MLTKTLNKHEKMRADYNGSFLVVSINGYTDNFPNPDVATLHLSGVGELELAKGQKHTALVGGEPFEIKFKGLDRGSALRGSYRLKLGFHADRKVKLTHVGRKGQ